VRFVDKFGRTDRSTNADDPTHGAERGAPAAIHDVVIALGGIAAKTHVQQAADNEACTARSLGQGDGEQPTVFRPNGYGGQGRRDGCGGSVRSDAIWKWGQYNARGVYSKQDGARITGGRV